MHEIIDPVPTIKNKSVSIHFTVNFFCDNCTFERFRSASLYSITLIIFVLSFSRAFKSFTLKKKSSTLGINKTSESPPPLRKYGNECLYDSNYNTYDSRYRQTVGGGGPGTTDVAFERNAPYRATVTGTVNSSAKSYVSLKFF